MAAAAAAGAASARGPAYDQMAEDVVASEGCSTKLKTMQYYMSFMVLFETYLFENGQLDFLLHSDDVPYPSQVPKVTNRADLPTKDQLKLTPHLYFLAHPSNIDWSKHTDVAFLTCFKAWMTHRAKTPKSGTEANGDQKFHSWKRLSKSTSAYKWAVCNAALITRGALQNYREPANFDKDMKKVKETCAAFYDKKKQARYWGVAGKGKRPVPFCACKLCSSRNGGGNGKRRAVESGA